MGSLELGLKEFEVIQRYDSEDYYKFEVKCIPHESWIPQISRIKSGKTWGWIE